jgi:hypothetical protein
MKRQLPVIQTYFDLFILFVSISTLSTLHNRIVEAAVWLLNFQPHDLTPYQISTGLAVGIYVAIIQKIDIAKRHTQLCNFVDRLLCFCNNYVI